MDHRFSNHEFAPPRSQIPARMTYTRARLIANPFLTILGLVLAFAVLKAGLRSRDLVLFMTSIIGMVISLLIIQYHCLDCGETGWAIRARRHLCPLGALRAMNASIGRPHFPTILAQLKIWFVIVAIGACYEILKTLIRR